MTYRDTEEAQRARIAELEGQLAEAERTITELRSMPRLRDRLFGAPLRFERTVTLPFEIDDRGRRLITRLLQARTGMDVRATATSLVVSGLGSSMAFSLSTEGGTTQIRLAVDRTRAWLGLAVLMPCVGAVSVASVVHAVVAAMSWSDPWWALTGLVGLWYLPMFVVFLRAPRRDYESRQAMFEEVLALAATHARPAREAAAAAVRAVVDDADAADDEAPAEDVVRSRARPTR
jgi:hypothetical protein